MPLIDDIQRMTPEERAKYDSYLSRQLAKKFATMFAFKLAVFYSINYGVKHLAKSARDA